MPRVEKKKRSKEKKGRSGELSDSGHGVVPGDMWLEATCGGHSPSGSAPRPAVLRARGAVRADDGVEESEMKEKENEGWKERWEY